MFNPTERNESHSQVRETNKNDSKLTRRGTLNVTVVHQRRNGLNDLTEDTALDHVTLKHLELCEKERRTRKEEQIDVRIDV